MIGKTLSHYKILEELGRGGMGIVYKAEDLKLNRTIAIKVLPSASLASEDDGARFYREARAAASLTHPNIAVVHEIDEAVPEGAKDDDLRPFIAMEFIEGETLHERIQKGPLKLDEAVGIASQIASGLEAAHAKNIVHRDIKSGNVMLTAKGEAKILDFGLAKTDASTILTRAGSTLGTITYMSPEQSRGEDVDFRSDLWSLGVVLYEMITGKYPFEGEYEQAIVYSILNESPEPLTAIRTGVPMALEWMVKKCLAKKPDDRYQSATDLLVDLRNVDLTATGSSDSRPSPDTLGTMSKESPVEERPTFKAAIRTTWPLIAASILFSLVAGYILFSRNASSPGSETLRTLPLFLDGIRNVKYPTISPASEYIAFTGTDSLGQDGIFLLDTRRGKIDYMTGTDGALFPSFSPDGSWLAYHASNTVYRVSVPKGVPEEIASGGRFALWQDRHNVLISGSNGVYRVNLDDRSPTIVFKADTSFGPGTYSYLWSIDRDSGLMTGAVLSNGYTVSNPLFVGRETGTASYGEPGIFSPMYVPGGFLIYQLEDQTSQPIVRPFDARTRQFTGPPLAELPTMRWDSYSVGPEGSLLSVLSNTSPLASRVQLFVVDIAEHTVEKKKAYFFPKYSPSLPSFSHEFEKVVLEYVSSATGESIIAEYDLDTEFASQLTFGDSRSDPKWSADGSTLYFSSLGSGSDGVYQRQAAGSGKERLIVPDGLQPNPSPDGKWLAFVRLSARSGADILAINLETGDEIALDTTQANTMYPDFSPGGRYVAFSYYPDPGIAVRSVGGNGYQIITDLTALYPKWSEDGKYIYYAVLEDGIYRVPVALKPGLQLLGGPERIVSVRGQSASFDIDPTGNYLIVTANEVDFRQPNVKSFSTLVWTQNWAQSLSER
ncbi:MAG: hypothetical protein BMS9Abin05_0764 [Rhodothermia bacterium]|nr:MAG: hypothetical protein BMS9Abin05_0764 [Rhodothermia bacterium]